MFFGKLNRDLQRSYKFLSRADFPFVLKANSEDDQITSLGLYKSYKITFVKIRNL